METLLASLIVPLVAVLVVSALCVLLLVMDHARSRSNGRTGGRERSSPAHGETLLIDRSAMREAVLSGRPLMDTRAVSEPDLLRPEPRGGAVESPRLSDLRRQHEAQARPSEEPRGLETRRDLGRLSPAQESFAPPSEPARPEPRSWAEASHRMPPPLSDSGRRDRPVPPAPPGPPETFPGATPARPGFDVRDPRRSGEFGRASVPDSPPPPPFRRQTPPPPLQPVGSNIVLNLPTSAGGYLQLPGKIDVIYGNFSPSDPREILFLWQANDSTPPRYTFSKSPGEGVSHVQLNHYTITSGTQAELRFLEGRPVLVNLIEAEDMERYQTRVNGIPLGPGESRPLSSGDIVSMGIYRLKISL